ncbi:MAG: ABC transporter substrate-binding protein [Frankiaceae bacterium]|nr:ABC transporter substrate-binding protein [Frankiaceae bacterium]
MSSSQVNPGGFNLASGLSGFAIGAAATVLAFVAINPNATSVPGAATAADTGTFTIPGLGGGGSTAALPQVGQTKTLADGTKVTRLSSGQLQVTDTAGRTRTVTIAGSSGSAATTVGGSAGTQSKTVGGSAGTEGQTIAGSEGSEGAAGSAAGSTEGGAAGSGSASGSGTQGAGAPGGNCSGGTTDTGVTASSIKLGATIAESGIAKSFLGEARQGMEAYKNRVNSQGGVCGRTLTIKYADDGWDPKVGKDNLENLINEEKVFAIAVSPSSEGVNAASNAGVFRNAKVPVVGTNGLEASQYKDPYIWPVAAATVTMLHVMMAKAWADGARNPAIVYDGQYRFGHEGANALEKAYERLSGGKKIKGSDVPGSCGSGVRYCSVQAGIGQYGNQVSIINNACKATSDTPACDYLVLLMEPDTAEQWMATPGAPTATQFSKGGLGAAQPLFTYGFGTTCGEKCNQMQVWTGYNPPLEQFATTAGVKQYVNDLKGQNSSADVYNQFTEGSYLGMQLLVDAMGRVGGNLTRAALVAALDATSLDTGLSATTASYSAGQHWAIGGAQGFTMQSQNGFSGWRASTPYMKDPWLGQDFG